MRFWGDCWCSKKLICGQLIKLWSVQRASYQICNISSLLLANLGIRGVIYSELLHICTKQLSNGTCVKLLFHLIARRSRWPIHFLTISKRVYNRIKSYKYVKCSAGCKSCVRKLTDTVNSKKRESLQTRWSSWIWSISNLQVLPPLVEVDKCDQISNFLALQYLQCTTSQNETHSRSYMSSAWPLLRLQVVSFV